MGFFQICELPGPLQIPACDWCKHSNLGGQWQRWARHHLPLPHAAWAPGSVGNGTKIRNKHGNGTRTHIQEDGGVKHKKRTSMKKSHGKKCPGSLQVPSFEEPNLGMDQIPFGQFFAPCRRHPPGVALLHTNLPNVENRHNGKSPWFATILASWYTPEN